MIDDVAKRVLNGSEWWEPLNNFFSSGLRFPDASTLEVPFGNCVVPVLSRGVESSDAASERSAVTAPRFVDVSSSSSE
jgi:hypothetical protein